MEEAAVIMTGLEVNRVLQGLEILEDQLRGLMNFKFSKRLQLKM